ncbi:hypothetical protein XELAEV_18046734mg [Xenopus laevis]|uniref:Uncharacterized protein n=1 Tax=Xenopus laevis TaxID=8355 RepID=A0A974BTV6_XENLA|nr:hypothetical protein XELAEV_18046734mg [Xenopus laevis]
MTSASSLEFGFSTLQSSSWQEAMDGDCHCRLLQSLEGVIFNKWRIKKTNYLQCLLHVDINSAAFNVLFCALHYP